MGIGNLQNVLNDYDGGKPVPYAQLYFDTAPDHHASAYNLLSGFGDDSSLYYWRLLGAAADHAPVPDRPRRAEPAERAPDRGRLAGVRPAPAGRGPPVRRPRTRSTAPTPAARSCRCPRTRAALGLALRPGDRLARGSAARVAPALYRGLRGPALDLLIELAARVRTLSGGAAPLIVTSAVSDERYQQLLGVERPAGRRRVVVHDRAPLRRPRAGATRSRRCSTASRRST